jgi:hypothetical protein
MSHHQDVREFLATRPGPVRITVDDQVIKFNFGDWHGVEVMGGYLASLTRTHSEVDWFRPRTLQLAGIGYHVGPTSRAEGSKLLFEGEGGIKVWEYPDAVFPRAWLSSATLSYRNPAELATLLETDTLNLNQTTLTQAAVPGLEVCPAGAVTLLKHDPSQVQISAQANCKSLLVLADSDDPGWSVTVDGQSVEKITVFHALRGVVVPKGNHRVEWSYSPPGFRPGLSLAGIGLVLIAGLQFWNPKWRIKPVQR